MKFVSFNLFRTLGFPDTTVLKPEQAMAHRELLQQADRVLFPEYWQLNALIYGLGCRVFPSEASYRIGHDKVEMTRAFEMVAPEHTPWTLIEPNTAGARDRIWATLPLPFVAKLPKASMGEGVWLIENRQDWRRYCEVTPVLYAQEYLAMDRDLRVVIVGEQVVAAYWRSGAGFHNNVARGGCIEHDTIPEAATALALRLARTLGVDHAGFDIAMVGNHPYVLEFNRLFGNQGVGGDAVLREAILDHLSRQAGESGPDGSDEPPWPVAV